MTISFASSPKPVVQIITPEDGLRDAEVQITSTFIPRYTKSNKLDAMSFYAGIGERIDEEGTVLFFDHGARVYKSVNTSTQVITTYVRNLSESRTLAKHGR